MINLIDLYDQSEVTSRSKFCRFAQELKGEDLVALYKQLRRNAPQRNQSNLGYFPEGIRAGTVSNKTPTNRREENLAKALYNASRAGVRFQLPNRQTLHLIDYQTPLKSKLPDEGVGKIDLLGVIDGKQLAVIELKIDQLSGRYGDTPLRAFIEGLAYCAMLESNVENVVVEANQVLGESLQNIKPILLIMAPTPYWTRYLHYKKAQAWLPELNRLSSEIRQELQIESRFIALKNVDFTMGVVGKPPQLQRPIKLLPVTDLSLDLTEQS